MKIGGVMSQDIQYLKGVGPMRAKVLSAELGVATLRDLLYTFPNKYIDRSTIHRIADLQENMPLVQLKGQIINIDKVTTGPHKRIKAFFTDGTGVVELVWFRSLKFVEKTLRLRVDYIALGKPTLFGGRFSMAHPELEEAKNAAQEMHPMQPQYHVTEGMRRSGFSSRLMSNLVSSAFSAIGSEIDETLPASIIGEHRLQNINAALRTMHYPASSASLAEAVRRHKFEELFYLQLGILRYANHRKRDTQGYPFTIVGKMFHRFYEERLPFELTGAQKRVIKEIRSDMRHGKQMNRLLQGDVGSGKTMVALMCCLIAIDNGFQACLMAPTEILAEQHLQTLKQQLGDLPVNVQLLTGNVKGKARDEVLGGIADGRVNILVGTHALIEPTVHFLNLGLAIIDEQHRFGVKQRAKLWQKNVRPPHVLVMTATPIPRTLAMTVYGDLDVSVIDELPPGRKPIQTIHYQAQDTPRMLQGIGHELSQGRQAYIVFPLIEESEKSDMQNLENGYEYFKNCFPQYAVAKVHGKMKPSDKEAAMREFSSGRAQILVSTTVIEVGVNVPNASVMVIQDADRFGLAQLHQLRGRVGRGADQSYCILATHHQLNENTARRMEIMTETTDGFLIAEEDMKLRGPGDIEGTQQSGIPFQLHVANILHDVVLMSEARKAAEKLLEIDGELKLPQHAVCEQQLAIIKRTTSNFSEIS